MKEAGSTDFKCEALSRGSSLYDDGAWKFQNNKISEFWKLSHSPNDCIITMRDERDLLGFELTPSMKDDIRKYWDIQYLGEKTYLDDAIINIKCPRKTTKII